MRDNLLETRDLSVGYGQKPLLEEVSISIRPGEILTLIGPNGAGKSTLLKTLTRQLAPLGGTVFLTGRELSAVEERELSRTMSILMTERADPELMTCRDVVAAGRYPYTGRFGILSEEDHRQIEAAMELVRVSELADRDFARISDGQRQRVMLARAICQEPRLLILDEPTSYLDIRYKLEFLQILRTLARERQVAVILSLHELELARKISDRLVCVKDGKICSAGTPEEIFSGDTIRSLYEADEKDFREIYGSLEIARPSGKFEHYIRSGSKLLRCGYTTGTCAALAAGAAARLLLTGRPPVTAALRTPKGLIVDVVPEFCRRLSDSAAECGIRKDAGDDPDITDGVIVTARVERTESGLEIDGGDGVGRVTKPGLDQPVGAAAINRVPRQMIEEEVREVCREAGYERGLRIAISIPGGEELAARTFNPQLGIEGGLSVLGTSGIVEPMSEQALLETIAISLKQAALTGNGRAILTPGNYGEEFLSHWRRAAGSAEEKSGPVPPEIPVVRVSNFIGDALDLAAELPFSGLLLVGHIGKFVKLAGGILNTHSKYADCRTALFCAHAAACGADAKLCKELLHCATTDACIALLKEAGLADAVLGRLVAEMQRQVDRKSGGRKAGVITFSNEFGLLGMSPEAEELLQEWNR